MIPDQIKRLISAQKKVRDRNNFVKSLRHLDVSKVASLAGSTYETVRNTVQMEQEHLLRRRAIRRILARMRTLKGGDPVHISEDLLKEIIWAKYTKNHPVPEIAIEEIGKVIYKYQTLLARFENKFHKKISKDSASDLYDILSVEIERIIVAYYEKDAIANIQYKNLLPLRLVREKELPEKHEPVQTYINVHRSLNKFDNPMIKYYMFNNAFKSWKKPTAKDIDLTVMKLEIALKDIRKHLDYHISNRKFKEFVRQSIPLKILNRTIYENLDVAEKILDQKATRDEYVLQICDLEYRQIRGKIRKSIVKTILYLLATKMVFALLAEVPYELYMHGHIDYFPIAVNVLFPPVLMAIIASSFKIPEKRNNQAILEMVDRLMDPAMGRYTNDGIARTRKRPFLFFLFKVFSNLMFFAVVGVITWVLKEYLNFSPVSIAIFVLFISLISFGALKTRNIATELVVVPVKGSIFTPLIDTIATPILHLGKRLSEGVAHLSPFPVILDNFVESPFKGFLMIFEEWNTYVREQREEIV